MSHEVCTACGEPLTAGLCISCDVDEIEALEAAQEDTVGPSDPLIGSIIADRYEVLKLQGVGGMARVYRALQRSLNREVVIKVISPDLLAEDEVTADEAIARFMVEAQAASKLNHPNVVSVFDFGRTPTADGGLLFMVMEFLSGSDLCTVHRADREMPFPRIASILQQTLAALGEAHFIGIAHRDVKPENIVIEPTRHRRDLVKVIDFGLARIGAMQTVTRVGQTVGTPHYMAPEQIAGAALGSGDLYSVGVILFELLTGQVPFDGETPLSILRKHLEAPRPDPRVVAPHRDIPPALADVCMRAMHVDPAQRWPDAESLSEAIVSAAGEAEPGSRASLPEIGGPPPISVRATLPPMAPERPSRPPAAAPVSLSVPRAPPRPRTADRGETATSAPLRGREADLEWASAILARGPTGWNLGLHGAPGTGRTRMLRAIADAAEARGLRVVRARAAAEPRGEVSLGAARHLISSMVGLHADDPGLGSGAAAGRDASANQGLRAIFSGERGRGPADAQVARASTAAALGWAARRAVEQAGGASVLLAVDDADALDNASRVALLDALAQKPLPRFFTLMTSEGPLPLPGERSDQRELRGLPPADAARLLQWLGGTAAGLMSARGADGEIEPLYVELLRRFRLEGSPSRAPGDLLELVETGLTMLAPAQRRLMLVAALMGGGSRADLGVVGRGEDVALGLAPLVAAGMLEPTEDGGFRVAHALFGRVAIAMAPGAAVADLHVAASDWLASEPSASEMRAYHAVRGRPDFETFLLVEECALQRTVLGDHDGAVEVFRAGMRAGQTLLQHGDVEAGGSACLVFGQKLGATLRGLDRGADAIAVLEECLRMIPAGDISRVGILEQLARAAGELGQLRKSEAWRTEGLAIARRLGARELVQRLVAMTRE